MRAPIELNVPTRWNDDHLYEIAALNNSACEIGSVYGSRQLQFLGHGRAPKDVPFVSDDRMKRHSEVARSLGLGFLYLYNGKCDHLDLGDPGIAAAALRDVDWVANELKPIAIVVADIRLARLVRSAFPENRLPIRVSTIAGILEPKDLEPWLEIGIEGVVLHHDVGRDFDLLRRFRSELDRSHPHVEIELLVNESCLYRCRWRAAHYAQLASAGLDYNEGFQHNCNIPKFKDPSLLLMARWIRPEDLDWYSSLGVRRFKIAGREMSDSWLSRCMRSYVSQKHEGNLVELLTMTPPGLASSASDLFFVDNAALNGFLGRVESSQVPESAFYRSLAGRLWGEGALRVDDPPSMYDPSSGTPRCTVPGSNLVRLIDLSSQQRSLRRSVPTQENDRITNAYP